MTRIRVYPAPWIGWLVLAIFVPVWGLVTYATFVESEGERIPIFIWAFITLILVVVGVALMLAGGRRLPTHELEIDDEDLKRLLGK